MNILRSLVSQLKQGGDKLANTVMAIHPYLQYGNWVFDDSSKGLTAELFVDSVTPVINKFIENVPHAREDGFTLIFSKYKFPGYQGVLEFVRPEDPNNKDQGNWYKLGENKLKVDSIPEGYEFWLCRSLFLYFDKAPDQIYIQAKELAGGCRKKLP